MINKTDILLNNLNKNRIEEELKKTKNDKKLKEACKDFEAFFLNMVIEEMRKGLPKNTLIPETNAMKIYEYMYYSTLTKEAVKGQSLGIADMLYNFLKNLT